jgi:hypothetical protein
MRSLKVERKLAVAFEQLAFGAINGKLKPDLRELEAQHDEG